MEKLQEKKAWGINCLERNLAVFFTFSSRNNLLSDPLRNLISATFNFFEKMFFFIFPKKMEMSPFKE